MPPPAWAAKAAAADAGYFDRLLTVVLPLGGAAAVIHEGYFDESGDIEKDERIFCISGYYIESSRAKELDTSWQCLLDRYNLPYFHMVDCAHGNEPFDKLSKDERIEA